MIFPIQTAKLSSTICEQIHRCRFRAEIFARYSPLSDKLYRLQKNRSGKLQMTAQQQLLQGDSIYTLPLDQLVLNEDMVPSFIPCVCQFISDFCYTEGVFRCSGAHVLVQNMGVVFFHPEVSIPPGAGVHDVCVFLKRWLERLPSPLIDPNVVNQYLVRDNPDSVRIVLQNLSVTARRTLACIFRMVKKVIDNEERNKMKWQNIAFCFFGTLTQKSKGLRMGTFPCYYFFMNAMALLEDGAIDFTLDRPLVGDLAVAFVESREQDGVNVEEYTRRIQEADQGQ